jgi:hypothetical protein
MRSISPLAKLSGRLRNRSLADFGLQKQYQQRAEREPGWVIGFGEGFGRTN